MPKRVRQKSNEKSAQKSKVNLLVNPGEILILLGKPLYFLLSNIILGVIFILFVIGKTTRVSLNFIFKPRKIKFPSIRLPKVALPKIKLPKIKTFKFKFPNIKIWRLRFSLFELKTFSKFKKKPKKEKKLKPKSKFRFIYVLILFVIILSLSFYFLILKDLPSPKNLTEREIEVSTKIYDRNGNLLYKIYKDKNRTIVPLSTIPDSVRLATLAAEDAEFYSHPGISVRGISRAFFQNLREGTLQGGSTITQQLVKNALLTPEKTVIRKIKEVILSFQVELTYSKDEILEMYLNEVSYGGTAYGAEEASFEYFGKDIKSLNLAEAAFLAGLPQSPTKYSPFGSDPSLAFGRQREVLHLMKINRFITLEQEDAALNQRLTFVADRKEIKAPHFVMYIRQILVDTYGEEMVEKGGLEVTTSLDLSIQELSEKVVKDEVDKLRGLDVGNGAALVINPKTGEILAMVGSKDYFDSTADGNVNVTTRLRQPGSSIKIVNYAYALSHDYTPATIIDDSPITYVTPGTTPYSPKNYDGQFRGRIPLRIALAESRNIPAVKILASYGVTKMIELGKAMGITTWEDPSRYGLSLTLGGGEVKLIDLAQVYATVANGGVRPEMTSILEVKDYKGKEIWKKGFNLTQNVLDPRVSYMLIDILKDNSARAGSFGTSSYLVVKNHPEVAVKTGTSNDLRDNLTAGFNQDYLVVTWVGNNDNSPMSRIASGVTGASPIWNKIISTLLVNRPSIEWEVPKNLVKINCGGRSEWFLEEKKNINFCATPSPKPNEPEKKTPQIL